MSSSLRPLLCQVMASALADRVIVYSGTPGVECTANTPTGLVEGFNTFLQQLDVTLRRDPANFRPRVNKRNSGKDREQKVRCTRPAREGALCVHMAERAPGAQPSLTSLHPATPPSPTSLPPGTSPGRRHVLRLRRDRGRARGEGEVTRCEVRSRRERTVMRIKYSREGAGRWGLEIERAQPGEHTGGRGEACYILHTVSGATPHPSGGAGRAPQLVQESRAK